MAVPIQSIPNGADVNQTLSFSLDSATQFAAPFELTKFDQDGATTGFLTKIDFDENGSVLATYSNGINTTLGRVALVRVANEQGLDKKVVLSGMLLSSRARKSGVNRIKVRLVDQ